MATPNDAAKAVQPTFQRPVRRSKGVVVPVIPLPYIQRRSQTARPRDEQAGEQHTEEKHTEDKHAEKPAPKPFPSSAANDSPFVQRLTPRLSDTIRIARTGYVQPGESPKPYFTLPYNRRSQDIRIAGPFPLSAVIDSPISSPKPTSTTTPVIANGSDATAFKLDHDAHLPVTPNAPAVVGEQVVGEPAIEQPAIEEPIVEQAAVGDHAVGEHAVEQAVGEPAAQEPGAQEHVAIVSHNSDEVKDTTAPPAKYVLQSPKQRNLRHRRLPSSPLPSHFFPVDQPQVPPMYCYYSPPANTGPARYGWSGPPNQQAPPNIAFGGYPDSGHSSPILSQSAGMGPPGLPYPNAYDGGRVQPPLQNGVHTQSAANSNGHIGQPHPAPYGLFPRPDLSQGVPPEPYVRRLVTAHGPPGMGSPGMGFDPNSPHGPPTGPEHGRYPTFDPSTPNSFHGSQSSAPTEHDSNGQAFYNQYQATQAGNPNGHSEYPVSRRARSRGRRGIANGSLRSGNHHQFNGAGHLPPMMPPMMDPLDGLVQYLQSHFGDNTFADYTLELRYSDDRSEPVRIPGHSLMFARSPLLQTLMATQLTSSEAPRTLLIQSGDRFLRSDAFWLATHRLYGSALLDQGPPAVSNSQLESNQPGSPIDRFNFALGYAAAGRLLQYESVLTRGIEVASAFVGWETVERAFEFALDGGLLSNWTLNQRCKISPPTYGQNVNILICSALNFITLNFMPNFELDTSITATPYLRRLPVVPKKKLPAYNNPRLSNIRFGDHNLTGDDNSSLNMSGFMPNGVLSRLLLELPFQLLKHVLESPHLGNCHMWPGASARTAVRTKVMQDVIEEREKRRKMVHDNRAVSNMERVKRVDDWEIVGFEEKLLPSASPVDHPVLSTNFVDFVIPNN